MSLSESHIIHHGSCLDPIHGMASLPDLSVDAIITDPPYSPHIHENIKNISDRKGTQVIDLQFKAIDDDLQESCAKEFARIARRWIVIFTDIEGIRPWKQACTKFDLSICAVGAWIKPNAMPQLTGDRPGAGWEALLIAHAPGPITPWYGKSFVWRTKKISTRSSTEERFHHTQKPLALMDEIVQAATRPEDLICDPFSGSGTTGVAAKRHQRRYIGWEQDPHYFQRSRERLAQTGVSFDLFRESNDS